METETARWKKPSPLRFAVVALVWLALLFAGSFALSAVSRGLELALVIALAVVGHLVVFRGLRTTAVWVLGAVPALAAVVWVIINEGEPVAPAVPLQWFVAGAAAAAAAFLLSRAASTHAEVGQRAGIALAGAVWWACWAIAAVAAVPSATPRLPGRVVTCAGQMKEIAVAAQQFESTQGHRPQTLDELVDLGLSDTARGKCLEGGDYALVWIPQANVTAEDAIILVCPNHSSYLITVSVDSHIRIYRQIEQEQQTGF